MAKSYEEWLKELALLNLKTRKLRGDMIAVLQYLKGSHREEGVDLFFVLLQVGPKPTGRSLREKDPNLK